MWSTEYSQETDVAVTKLWQTFVAIHEGRLSLPGGDVFQPEGPLAVGVTIATTPAGQETMTSTVSEFVPERAYADQTEFNGLLLTFQHLFEPLTSGTGTRITHRLTISGDAADQLGPVVGPQISADFPEQMQALIDVAQ